MEGLEFTQRSSSKRDINQLPEKAQILEHTSDVSCAFAKPRRTSRDIKRELPNLIKSLDSKMLYGWSELSNNSCHADNFSFSSLQPGFSSTSPPKANHTHYVLPAC